MVIRSEIDVTLKTSPIVNYFCLLDPKNTLNENKDTEYILSLSEILRSRNEKLGGKLRSLDKSYYIKPQDADLNDYNRCVIYTPYCIKDSQDTAYIITSYTSPYSHRKEKDLEYVLKDVRNWMMIHNVPVATPSDFYEKFNISNSYANALIDSLFNVDGCPIFLLVSPMK